MLQIDFLNALVPLSNHNYCKQHAIANQVLQPSQIVATLSMFHYCIIVFKVNSLFNKEIPWVLLFLLTLWPVIEKIRDAVPSLTKQTWYLDDGFVAGTENQIRTTLDILANEGQKRVLYLRKDKCKLCSIVDLPSVDREVTIKTGD